MVVCPGQLGDATEDRVAKRKAERRQRRYAGAPPGKGAAAASPEGTSWFNRVILWAVIGSVPPLVYGAVVLLGSISVEDPAVTSFLVEGAFVIAALFTLNVVFRNREAWTPMSTPVSTYIAGLFSIDGVAHAGILAYLLTGSLTTFLTLEAVSLLGTLLLFPRR